MVGRFRCWTDCGLCNSFNLDQSRHLDQLVGLLGTLRDGISAIKGILFTVAQLAVKLSLDTYPSPKKRSNVSRWGAKRL